MVAGEMKPLVEKVGEGIARGVDAIGDTLYSAFFDTNEGYPSPVKLAAQMAEMRKNWYLEY